MKKVFIPIMPVSFNKIKGKHWRAYKKQKDKWHYAMAFLLGTNSLERRQDCKMDITITTFYESNRNFLDQDNFITGCKPIYDVLKALNYIFDDSLKWVDRHEYQRTLSDGKKQKCCEETGTEIVIRRAVMAGGRVGGVYL